MTEQQALALEAELAAAAPGALFHGEGELSHELFARELIDPQRSKPAPSRHLFWRLPE